MLLALWVGPAIWAGDIAKKKGRSQGGFVALTLVIGWFGLLIAALVRADHVVAAAPSQRPCPHCAEPIQRAAQVCRFCGREVEPATASPAAPGAWHVNEATARGLRCFNGHENVVGVRKCGTCGSKSLVLF